MLDFIQPAYEIAWSYPGCFLMQGHRRVYSADEADKCFTSLDNMQDVYART